ncbi:MAG: hypothetical protein ACOY3M_02750 [Patescibacteria group bacterium]
MFDYLFGLLLFVLGLGRPSVLGEQASDSAKPSAQLKLMRPKFSAEQQEAFQKERMKQEANIKRISDARMKELEKTYAEKQKSRSEKDAVTKQVLAEKLAGFKDAQKRQKVQAMADTYQKTVPAMLAGMQKKLTDMMSLLDRITAAAGAMKTQGVDVAEIESNVAAAQAKVSSVLYAVEALTESVPTVLTVSGEDAAGEDIKNAVRELKESVRDVRSAFAEAHKAVGIALENLEEITNAVEVGER